MLAASSIPRERCAGQLFSRRLCAGRGQDRNSRGLTSNGWNLIGGVAEILKAMTASYEALFNTVRSSCRDGHPCGTGMRHGHLSQAGVICPGLTICYPHSPDDEKVEITSGRKFTTSGLTRCATFSSLSVPPILEEKVFVVNLAGGGGRVGSTI